MMNFTNTTRAEQRVYCIMDYRVYHLVRDQAKVNGRVKWQVFDQIIPIRNIIKQEIK